MKLISYLLTLACGIAFFTLGGCDSNDEGEDLFLLNPLRVSDTFFFPRDSTVTLAPREVAFEFQFDGSAIEPFQTFEVESEGSASLNSFIQSQGFELEDILQARIQNQRVTFRLLSPTSDDLGVIEEVTLLFTDSGLPDELVAQGSSLFGDVDELFAVSDITQFISEPEFGARLVLRTGRETEPAQYRIQVLLNVVVTVDATPPFEGTISLDSEAFNVRSFLQSQGFDVGDVRRARARTIRISESSSSDALSARVQRATVRLRSTGEEGEGVVIGRLTEFDEEVEVEVDIENQITRTGRVELIVELDLRSGGNPSIENYSFTTEVEIDVEVPQPSAATDPQ